MHHLFESSSPSSKKEGYRQLTFAIFYSSFFLSGIEMQFLWCDSCKKTEAFVVPIIQTHTSFYSTTVCTPGLVIALYNVVVIVVVRNIKQRNPIRTSNNWKVWRVVSDFFWEKNLKVVVFTVLKEEDEWVFFFLIFYQCDVFVVYTTCVEVEQYF